MATTRNKRVPMQEQIKLINECRKSGLTDADWCRENGIAPSTFYNWVSRCRKTAADIQEPNYGHHETPQPKQDEPDGFVLIYKRLSVAGGYQWPRKQSEVRNLTWREFDWLMSGIDIDQPKALRVE